MADDYEFQDVRVLGEKFPRRYVTKIKLGPSEAMRNADASGPVLDEDELLGRERLFPKLLK